MLSNRLIVALSNSKSCFTSVIIWTVNWFFPAIAVWISVKDPREQAKLYRTRFRRIFSGQSCEEKVICFFNKGRRSVSWWMSERLAIKLPPKVWVANTIFASSALTKLSNCSDGASFKVKLILHYLVTLLCNILEFSSYLYYITNFVLCKIKNKRKNIEIYKKWLTLSESRCIIKQYVFGDEVRCGYKFRVILSLEGTLMEYVVA